MLSYIMPLSNFNDTNNNLLIPTQSIYQLLLSSSGLMRSKVTLRDPGKSQMRAQSENPAIDSSGFG
jgi:hypothetical protein